MRTKPELKCTRDYSLFELHEMNRPLHEDPKLFESMKAFGWMPSKPAQVVSNGNGKLKIVAGHHRFDIAKRLRLAVWYVIDDTNADPWHLEGSSRSTWSGMDFAVARASSGNKDVQAVIEFMRKHGVNIGVAASLLGGESAGSGNKLNDIKAGTFKVAADLTHARQVVSLIDQLKALNVDFATQTAFVSALSMLLHVPEFVPAVLVHKVRLNKALLERRSTADRYLDVIEATCNWNAKKPVPLAFLAREASRARRLNGRAKA